MYFALNLGVAKGYIGFRVSQIRDIFVGPQKGFLAELTMTFLVILPQLTWNLFGGPVRLHHLLAWPFGRYLDLVSLLCNTGYGGL